MTTVQLTIDALGARGDGIAQTPKGQVFVPFTLAGEVVSTDENYRRGQAFEIVKPSDQRIAPACEHFTHCGGCSLQHWDMKPYHAWKRERLIEALNGQGIEIDVAPLIASQEHARRRITLEAKREGADVVLGFHQALSDELIDLKSCPVAHPRLVEAMGDLRTLVKTICPTNSTMRLSVTVCDNGIDVALSGLETMPTHVRRKAIELAIELKIARLSLDSEVLIETEKPYVTMSGAQVFIPPGAFLQASQSAEVEMTNLVAKHIGKAKRVGDLFAGCGTFTLQLAKKSQVYAFEHDRASLHALDHAARHAADLRRVVVEQRDLFQRPLLARELLDFDAIVFDPPRAGAEAQVKQMARSNLQKVAAVSCNPTTLARDLRILIDGGYRLKSVTPIDQFLWSSHVEAVALLDKPKKRR